MLWTCVWDAPRPFIHPLRTPAGAVLTTEAPADHPWHHALWFTIKYLNGENFWEEYGDYGRLRTSSTEERDGAVTASVDWVRPGDGVAARERRTIAAAELDGTSYALDWDVELVPTEDTVFDRTPFTTWGGYSGLTLRGAPDWRDTQLLLPDGRRVDRVLGDRHPWCALEGVAPLPGGGEGSAGVVVMDHPSNERHPTPWYGSNRADTYGDGWANFLNAAFLWDGPLHRAAGEPLRIRHRVVVHDGTWDHDRIGGAYAEWVA